MKKFILFSLLSLASGLCAKEYVCYRYAKKLGGLTTVAGQSVDCQPGYALQSPAVKQKINELFDSPNITMDRKLVTCCKERAGESVGRWSSHSDKIVVPVGVENLFLVEA